MNTIVIFAFAYNFEQHKTHFISYTLKIAGLF